MRSLILGGAGFIGYHLAAVLVEANHKVLIVDDLSRGTWDATLQSLPVQHQWVDLTSGPWPAGMWDHVYLLAAVVGVPTVEREPLRTIEVNTRIVLRALRWLKHRRQQRIFFASTSEAYAGVDVPIPTPETVPVSIGDVTQPRAVYAASKILGEVALLHSSARVTVGRFHNIYGPRMGLDHVMPNLCTQFARRENPVRVLGPECRRAFCYVTDAVRAIRLLMDAPEAIGQIVNVGDDRQEVSVLDLVQALTDLTGFVPELDVQPAPKGSVLRRCPDLTRLRAWTRYEPRVSLADGLKETFVWYNR